MILIIQNLWLLVYFAMGIVCGYVIVQGLGN